MEKKRPKDETVMVVVESMMVRLHMMVLIGVELVIGDVTVMDIEGDVVDAVVVLFAQDDLVLVTLA